MNRILKLLNLRRSELPRLVHAAFIFFLVSVNDGIVKSVASAVFNIRVGVEHLPLMYSWIAVLFSLSMALLSWLTAKTSRQGLLFGLMGSVGLLLALNTGMLLVEHHWAIDLRRTGFYSFLFVSSELARSLAGFHIWIVAGGICYTSRAKVLFPLLAASAILGDISGGFAVRLLGPLLQSYQLYGLSVLNMALIVGFLRPLVRRYFISPQGEEGAEAATLSENLRYFSRSNYLKLLFLLSIAVLALYTAIHYGFNVVARTHYPSEAEITGFFGLFFGTTGVATLIVSFFLLRLILRWLGTGNVYLWVCVAYGLIALVLLGVFQGTVVLPQVGMIFIFNLLNYLILDSIVAPTYQVLIKMVSQRHSDGTRMIMEGGFMLLGGLLGAGLTLLHARAMLSLGELFLVLILLSAAMVVAGWYFKKSYTEVLIRAVREQAIDVDDDQAMASLRQLISQSAEFPRSLLQHQDDGVRQMGIEILRQNPGPAAQEVCLGLIEHDNPRIRSAALEALSIDGAGDEATSRILPRLDDGDEEVQLSTARALARTLGTGGPQRAELSPERQGEVSAVIVPRLSPDARPAALQAEFLVILTHLQHQATAAQRQAELGALLESEIPEEIIAGIQAAGRMGDTSCLPHLLAHLKHPHPAVREAAAHNLKDLEHEGVFEGLLGLLADPDPDVVEAAVETLSKTANPAHWRAMVEALSGRSLKEWEGLVAALIALESEDLTPALMASCRERLVEANRYLVAIDLLGRQESGAVLEVLADQLRGQNQVVQSGVIRLLGYLGDVDVVGDLLERLSEEDPEARENAIELLENIADRELLEHLLPLLADDPEEQLEAARQISGWEEVDLEAMLRYLLETPDSWTQMAAVWAAGGLRPSLLEHLPAGLAPPVREAIEQIQVKRQGEDMTVADQPLTTMEKITFLKQSPLFAALPLEELYHIALSMQEESVGAGADVIREGTRGDKMYIVVTGRFEVRKFAGTGQEEGQQIAVLEEKQVFGDMALLDDEPRSASVIALEDAHLLSLQRSSLERLLRRYSSIAFNMMRILSQRLRG